jgi:hypothetical protein
MKNPKTVAMLAEIAALYDTTHAADLGRTAARDMAAHARRGAEYWQSMLDERQSLANLSNYVGAHECVVIEAYQAA